MSKEQLEEHIVRLREELDREREERNYFQLERDKVTTFWEITKRQLEERKAELRNKDREMEEAEERHQVEIKVYKQKVKHLLYEHQNNIAELKAESKYIHVLLNLWYTFTNLTNPIIITPWSNKWYCLSHTLWNNSSQSCLTQLGLYYYKCILNWLLIIQKGDSKYDTSLRNSWRFAMPLWFPCELTSEKRTQKSHTDDASPSTSSVWKFYACFSDIISWKNQWCHYEISTVCSGLCDIDTDTHQFRGLTSQSKQTYASAQPLSFAVCWPEGF